MSIKYSSTCIHCGPCQRYARNDVCVTCAARRAAETTERRKQARELGATATDVIAGTACRVCGEVWRYAVSRKCVTCAEITGNTPKPKREPKPKPEPLGGHLGKKPKDRAYAAIARVTVDGRIWELWERQGVDKTWRDLKLFCMGRNPQKANFWLGWSTIENRFANSKTSKALTEHYPVLAAFVEAVMLGDDIGTLFGGEYCINDTEARHLGVEPLEA